MTDRAPDAGPLTERVLDLARRLVERETPSGDAPRAAALAEELAGELARAGADVALHEAPGRGRHVVARVPGVEPDLPQLLAIGHFDTVHPVGTLEQLPFRVDGARAQGPGLYDMKVNLAVLVEALAGMAADGARPRRNLVALLTCDEEVGSHSSRPLLEEEARSAGAALVLEPAGPGGAAKTARKGIATYTLRVHGRAAHAGLEPERGISAVAELARQIPRILDLQDAARGTTLNVGLVSGGTASNVVAAEAAAELEARYFHTEEALRVDAGLRALVPVLAGARLELEGGENRPPLEKTDEIDALFQHARREAAELGFDLHETAVGGASDGNFTAALGVPTLDGLGVTGGGAHALTEHILVADIPFRVQLLRRLLETV